MNWNHVWRDEYESDLQKYSSVVNVTGIDNFLESDPKNQELHPEKRMKAAWRDFVEERIAELKKEDRKMKRSQMLQLISKEFKTSEKNPMVKAKHQGGSLKDLKEEKRKEKDQTQK